MQKKTIELLSLYLPDIIYTEEGDMINYGEWKRKQEELWGWGTTITEKLWLKRGSDKKNQNRANWLVRDVNIYPLIPQLKTRSIKNYF